MAQKMSTGERKVLVEDGFWARYLATGHLIYLVDNVLTGVAFDARRLEVTGAAVPVLRGVARGSFTNPMAYLGYSVAADGTLVYVYSPSADGGRQVALSDRAGKVTPLTTLPAVPYEALRMSPDGKRVAVGVADPKEAYVAIYDMDGKTVLRRLTFGANNRYPVWSRDGLRVTYQSDREGDPAIFWQLADGTGPAERLTKPDKNTAHVPASWAPNDETLLFTVVPSGFTHAGGALWTYARASGTAAPFGGVTLAAQSPMFSPDGQWVAYAEMRGDGGPVGIYVQPFPASASGTKYQLPPPPGSSNLTLPVWSPEGKEIFFAPMAGQLAVASVTTRPTFAFGNPAEVPRAFSGTLGTMATAPRVFDITPNGLFIGLHPPGQSAGAAGTVSNQREIHIVLNWTEELKPLVPVK